MSKKGLKRKIVAGLAALAVFVTSAGLPIATQTVCAEEAGLPTDTNTSFAKARELEFGTSMAGTFPNGGGRQYYKFSLEQASKLDLSYERNSPNGSIEFIFYDASQTEIGYCVDREYSRSWSDIYLTGGNYYMVVDN